MRIGRDQARAAALVTATALAMLVPACSTSSTSGGTTSPNIDMAQASVDQVAPSDAVVNVATAFGAVGDGKTDDTAAIQAAISSGLGFGNLNKVLYLPAGTYLISKPLEWRQKDGRWSTFLTLMGQNRDHTILKLADFAAGFQSPTAPQALIVTGSQGTNRPDGAGNQAFHNFISNLTVDVGSGNPGANGIDFLANNRGAIRDVVVRSGTGSGQVGISMTRSWAGPAILERLRVEGFNTGILLTNTEYSMVAENIELSGQRQVGIDLRGNVLSIRRLSSDNLVPAIRNGGPTAPGSLLTLLDSSLIGGQAGSAAIENNAAALLRNVRTSGYSSTVLDHGQVRSIGNTEQWSSPPSPGQAPDAPRLPVIEQPQMPHFPADQWMSAQSLGARVSDNVDDTVAIQAALNSGKPVVYLRAGRYTLSKTLRVPASVHAIVGFEATIDMQPGAFASGAAAFDVASPSTDPVFIKQILFQGPPNSTSVERTADRPVVLEDMHFAGLPFRGTPGQIFLDDVESGTGWRFTPGQQIWGRQFNAEQPGLKVANDGAQLWILGLKTEKPSTAIASTNGATTEVLGGLLYAVMPTKDQVPAFTSQGSTQSLTFATSAYSADRNYHVLVSDANSTTSSGQLRDLQAPRRWNGSIVILYSKIGSSS